MRRIYLLTLLTALTACLGSECSGGGNHSNAAGASAPITAPSGEITRDPAAPTPEPSAALVFGVGLLVAFAASRRRS